MKNVSYNNTIYACFIGYIAQAIINNFAPLLFLTFQSDYGISLDMIALLTTINFSIQIVVDCLATKLVDKIGYRVCAIFAHISAAIGIAGLAFFPMIIPNPYIGIIVAIIFGAIGGGLIEVIINPIVEACPGEKKDAAMSLLHSFYCWGHVGVVVLSSLFFALGGIKNWRYLAVLWAIIPLANIILFAKVPMPTLLAEGGEGKSIRKLLHIKQFWILILIMASAGACEQAVSQWASAYAESVMKVPKVIGDLAGPLLFAVTMGCTRLYYGKFSQKIKLERFMFLAGVLCFASYIIIAVPSNVVIGFIGFALCGLSVGILWPGTLSIAAKQIRGGGTALFALLALAGDIGCAGGPTYVGIVSKWFGNELRIGILAALIFPILLLVALYVNKHSVNNKSISG